MARSYKSKSKRSPFRAFLKIISWSLAPVLIISFLEVFLVRYINPPFTVYQGARWLHSIISREKYQLPEYRWCPIVEISPYLKKAILAGEDQRFLIHHGFDFVEMGRAARDFVKKGRVRGASTISMQTARTLFLWPKRDYMRKLLEIYYTSLIEIVLSKRRILELYLNTVDWGDGIIGAEAASVKYFRRHCWEITPAQAALLAAVLPSPHRWQPNRPNMLVMLRYRKILKEMDKMPSL